MRDHTPLAMAPQRMGSDWRWHRAVLRGIALVGVGLFAATSLAAVPPTAQIEGTLRGAGGVPVADGAYKVSVALYPDASGGVAVWSEGPLDVSVSGGTFAAVLGSKTPIDTAALAGGSLWLGVKVAAEPELPRQPLRSAPYALRASVAEGIDCKGCVPSGAVGFGYAGAATKGGPSLDLVCTGCVEVAEMLFNGDVDLGGHSLKAGSGTFTGDIVAKSVTATAFAGDGSKLTGLKTPSGACAPGQAVVGIASDGKLICKSVAEALPADGLDEVSGGLLSTQFTDKVSATAGIAIPDNTGQSAFVNLKFPDLGTTQGLSVQVKLSNSDLSTVALTLLPPDNKKVGIVLCDPCGGKDAKALDTSFPDATPVKTGDLGAYIGKAITGEWTLVAVDSAFCVKQAPGNAAICDLDAKIDGAIAEFSVTAKTLSSKKVGASGLLQLLNAAKEPQACAPSISGAVYYDTSALALRYCDGKAWRSLADTCGNGIVEPTEECDDGNNADGDGCSASCVAAYGLAEKKPGTSCKDILAVNAGAKLGDGVYWLDPDGSGGAAAYRVWCDLTSAGGGWTLAAKVDGGKDTFNYDADLWTTAKLLAADQVSTAASEAKYPSFGTVAHSEVRLVMSAGGQTNALTVPIAATSLQSLFAGGHKATVLGRIAWKSLMAGASMQPHCNLEGVNADCSGRKVRLGFLTNQEDDCASCDSYLGVGHSGQPGCDAQGSSWAGMMASCTADNGAKNVPAFTWVWVR